MLRLVAPRFIAPSAPLVALAISATFGALAATTTAVASAPAASSCAKTVYLTIDTGNMAPAEEMATILRKHGVKATFFLANEKTVRGDTSLDPAWTAYWKARADEGHAFGSHTWRHWYFRGDVGDKVRYVPWSKSEASKAELLDAKQVCRELDMSAEAFKQMTGKAIDKIWRAPGGKLTPNAERHAAACGYRHVAWSPAGFSGDELPADKYPADRLIASQLNNIRHGDILLWHLGIWSRKPPLYPELDTLLAGLKSRGFCFARIPDHPQYRPKQ